MQGKFISRRSFLQGIPVTAVGLPYILDAKTGQSGASDKGPILSNDFFAIYLHKETGRFSVHRTDGSILIPDCAAMAVSSDREVRPDMIEFRHRAEVSKISDALGEGKRLIIYSSAKNSPWAFTRSITLYKRYPGIFLDMSLINKSNVPVNIESLFVVTPAGNDTASLLWSGTSKVLTNGPMYYDPGTLYPFSAPDESTIQSWWNAGFFSGYKKEALVCGALENLKAQGKIHVRRLPGDAISLSLQSYLARGFMLQPGQEVHSNRFIILVGSDPYSTLEEYASLMGRLNNARVSSIVNGWCSWFYTYEHVTEEEVVRNAELASRILKPCGLEYIQIDEGYQRWHGDWEGNSRFPHGMKWLADKIKSFGLKPGLWVAPYVISEPTEVYQQHADWLLKHPDGRLKRVGPWPGEDTDWARNENPKRYGLDITHPGAAHWMFNLFSTIVHEWGYEMLKIDFVDWSLLSAYRYYDPSVSRAEAYRRGFEIIRRAAGEKVHINECGPGAISVGLIDSMRIELDQYYGYRTENWKQYVGTPTGSAAAGAKRYYFHKRTWINDVDHLCTRNLSLGQARAAATIIGISGGNVISGDRLIDLSPDRIEIIRKAFPSSGQGARPVDLFDSDTPSAFALSLKKPFGEWTVAAFFNPDETQTIKRPIPADRLWLDPARKYIAFNFWEERLEGEFSGELDLQIPPAGCTLLSIHELPEKPKVIATNRHILQGYLELENTEWNEDTQILSGTSFGVKDYPYSVFIYLPGSYPWIQGGTTLDHDKENYSYRITHPHIITLRLYFTGTEKISWQINLAEFLKER